VRPRSAQSVSITCNFSATLISANGKSTFIPGHCAAKELASQSDCVRVERPAILPMNLKTVALICNELRVLRFKGAMRVQGRGDLILAPQPSNRNVGFSLP
jgi:hypothetical protein